MYIRARVLSVKRGKDLNVKDLNVKKLSAVNSRSKLVKIN